MTKTKYKALIEVGFFSEGDPELAIKDAPLRRLDWSFVEGPHEEYSMDLVDKEKTVRFNFEDMLDWDCGNSLSLRHAITKRAIEIAGMPNGTVVTIDIKGSCASVTVSWEEWERIKES